MKQNIEIHIIARLSGKMAKHNQNFINSLFDQSDWHRLYKQPVNATYKFILHTYEIPFSDQTIDLPQLLMHLSLFFGSFTAFP